jgi:hypothetical protein
MDHLELVGGWHKMNHVRVDALGPIRASGAPIAHAMSWGVAPHVVNRVARQTETG